MIHKMVQNHNHYQKMFDVLLLRNIKELHAREDLLFASIEKLEEVLDSRAHKDNDAVHDPSSLTI